MHTTTQATGESVVGDENMAMTTADTGIASFKETGARVPILADEGSKGNAPDEQFARVKHFVTQLASHMPIGLSARTTKASTNPLESEVLLRIGVISAKRKSLEASSGCRTLADGLASSFC